MAPMPNSTSQNAVGTVAITTASIVIIPHRYGKLRRSQFVLTNTGTTDITVVKGDVAAVAGSGIVLGPGDQYGEADDQGFSCWQGYVLGISSAAGGTLAFSEVMVG